MNDRSRRIVGLVLFGILVLPAIIYVPQQAEAISAATGTYKGAYTSIGTLSLQDRGGGVYDNGTIIFIAEAHPAGYAKLTAYNKTSDAIVKTGTIPITSTSIAEDPSAIVVTSTKHDIIALQRVGGNALSLRTTSTTFDSEFVNGATSELAGKQINELHLWLKKTGAPTGTAIIAVFDSAGNTLYQFGTQDVSLLTTSFVEMTYRGTGAGYVLQNGDRFGVFFNGGSAGNTLDVDNTSATDRYDGGTLSQQSQATGTQGSASWVNGANIDMRFQISFNHVNTLADDNNLNSYWENSGYVTREIQVNDGTTCQAYSAQTICAEKKTTSSLLAGDNVDRISLKLTKVGTPTGTGTAGEFDSSGTLLNTFGTIDVSTISTTASILTFTSSSDFTLSSGATTYIGFHFSGGDVSNNILVHRTAIDVYDGTTNSVFSVFTGTWGDITTSDMKFIVVDTAANDQEAGANIYLDMGSSRVAGAVAITFNDTSKIPQKLDLESSTDASVWTVHRNGFEPEQTTERQVIEILDGAPLTARYWRLSVDTWGSDNSMAVSEFDHLDATQDGSTTQSTMLSEFSTDGTVYAYGCNTVNTCGGASGVLSTVSRIDLDNWFFEFHNYTTASTEFTLTGDASGSDGASGFGGVTDDWVYLLETDCDCTQDDFWLHRFPRDLSSKAIWNTWTEATNDGYEPTLAATKSKIFAWDSGASDDNVIVATISGTLDYIFWRITASTEDKIGAVITAYEPEQIFHYGTRDGKVYMQTIRNSATQDIETYKLDSVALSYTTDTLDYKSIPNTNGFSVRDDNTLTYSSDPEDLYLAVAARAHGINAFNSSGGQVSYYVNSTTPGSGLFNSAGQSRFYYIDNGLYLESGAVTGTSWNFVKHTGTQLTVNVYNEALNAALTQDTSDTPTWVNDVLRLACDGYYKVPTTKMIVGSTADCTSWQILDDVASPTGRTIKPFTTTVDLVFNPVFTTYSFEIQTTTPTIFTLRSKYDGKIVDTTEIDSASQGTQFYVFGQCYTVEIVNENTGAVVLTGNVCANDFFTKTISLSSVVIPPELFGSVWKYSLNRNFTTASNNTITLVLDKPEDRPWNASIYFTNHYLDTYKTYERIINYTNANNFQTTVVHSFTSNDTIYITAFEPNFDTGKPVLTLQSSGRTPQVGNFFSFLGNLAGIPVTGLFAVLVAAAFVRSNAYFGIIVTAAVVGVMAAMGMFTIDATLWGVLMVLVALGVFGARRYF